MSFPVLSAEDGEGSSFTPLPRQPFIKSKALPSKTKTFVGADVLTPIGTIRLMQSQKEEVHQDDKTAAFYLGRV